MLMILFAMFAMFPLLDICAENVNMGNSHGCQICKTVFAYTLNQNYCSLVLFWVLGFFYRDICSRTDKPMTKVEIY